MSKVIVAKPENYTNSTQHTTYPVIGINNGNPDYGYILLRSDVTTIAGGFLQTQKRVGRFSGRVEELEKFVAATNLKEGMDFNAVTGMNARLIIQEANEPFYPGQDCKRYPDNSDYAGQPVLSGGKEVYRQTIIAMGNDGQTDTLLATDSKESVPAQMAPNTEFAQRTR